MAKFKIQSEAVTKFDVYKVVKEIVKVVIKVVVNEGRE